MYLFPFKIYALIVISNANHLSSVGSIGARDHLSHVIPCLSHLSPAFTITNKAELPKEESK